MLFFNGIICIWMKRYAWCCVQTCDLLFKTLKCTWGTNLNMFLPNHFHYPKDTSDWRIQKNRELTQCPCVQVACNMPLESSRQGLQLRFRPHPNQRSTQEVIVPQSRKSSNLGDFKTPIWECWDKKSFGWGRYEKVQSILYGGRWWLPPSLGCGESCESEVARGSFLAPKVLQLCTNHFMLVLCKSV